MTIYEKLLDVQKLGLTFKKDTKAYNYKYVTLDSLWEKLQPILSEHKILVTHAINDRMLTTSLIDTATESDPPITSTIQLPEGIDPQKLGSAITYFRRYNLLALLNLMTEDDDDGDSAVKSSSKKPEANFLQKLKDGDEPDLPF